MLNSINYPIQDGQPYFMGDEALIRFSTGEDGLDKNTFWLVNKTDHTIRPFESHMALSAVFGDNLKEALNNVVTVSHPSIDDNGEITDGVLADFSLLGPEYAIKNDGSSKELHFSTYQLKNRYGQDINEEKEAKAAEAISQFFSFLDEAEDKTGLPTSFLNKIKEDKKLMAFYISSMAYGKYTLKDIYLDIGHLFEQSKE